MRRDTIREVNGTPLRILRPLLGSTRSEIDAYLARHLLEFRDDSSNLDSNHTRNRIRHHLLPTMEEVFGRDFRASILRTADLLRSDEECLLAQLPEISDELSVSVILTLPVALQRRLLHGWLKYHGVGGLSFDLIERVRALLTQHIAKVNLPGAMHARRRAGRLFIEITS